jgi:hypothetical protein
VLCLPTRKPVSRLWKNSAKTSVQNNVQLDNQSQSIGFAIHRLPNPSAADGLMSTIACRPSAVDHLLLTIRPQPFRRQPSGSGNSDQSHSVPMESFHSIHGDAQPTPTTVSSCTSLLWPDCSLDPRRTQ